MTIQGKAGFCRCAAVGVLIAAFTLSSVPTIGAEPSIEQKRAQAKTIAKQVEALDQTLEIATEEFNQASDALDEIQARLELTREKLSKARRRLVVRQATLNHRAKAIYLNGKIEFFEVVLSTQSFDDFLRRLDLVTRIGDSDAKIVGSVKAARRVLETRKRQLAAQQARQKRITASREKKKKSIEASLGKREKLLASVKDEIEAYERAERARAEAQRRRYLAAQTVSDGDGGGGGGTGGGPAHGNVVSVAMAQLGKPYRYGASGPDAFDCSGLTMYCYAQVGIGLPHSSSAQYGCGSHVSRDNLQPGDLVFFYNPIHHVGLYIGGGNMIHAPRTGDVVKIASVDGHGNYVGATRP